MSCRRNLLVKQTGYVGMRQKKWRPSRFPWRSVFFSALVSTLLVWPALGAEDVTENVEQNRFGVTYVISDRDTAEHFLNFIELFGYLNDVDIIYDGKANIGVLILFSDDVLILDDSENIVINRDFISHFPEEDKDYIIEFIFSSKDCGIRVPEVSESSNSLSRGKTIVVSNTRGLTTDQQLKCLGIGILASLGVSKEELNKFATLGPKKILSRILLGDFNGVVAQ